MAVKDEEGSIFFARDSLLSHQTKAVRDADADVNIDADADAVDDVDIETDMKF